MSIKIIVLDEVNVKISGLDVKDRRKLSNQFKYQVPYARHLPAVKLGRWDGCISYFSVGGATYLQLLPEILPKLEHLDLELEDRRVGWNLQFDPVDADTVSYAVWPEDHPDAGKPVQIRDYQVEAINSFLAEPQSLSEISTGSGKTLITAVLCKRAEKYGRTITIVPNKDLVTQTLKYHKLIGLDVGVFFGDRKEYHKTHTICTWQSLSNLGKATKDGTAPVEWSEFVAGVNCVIVDECHGVKGDVLKGILTGPLAQVPIRWGMTGTVPKEQFEFRCLQISLGPVINKLRAKDLQDQGVLAKCHVNIVQIQDQRTFKNYQSELKYLLSDTARLDFIGNLVNQVKANGNTLVLVDRVEAGRELVSRIPDAVFISGEVKSQDRKDQYDEIRTADNKVIVATYGVAAVGIDIPRLFNVVLIEPGKSFVRTIQSIGRGLRRAGDKDTVEIWDITSSCKFSKRHLTQRKKFYDDAEYPWNLQRASV